MLPDLFAESCRAALAAHRRMPDGEFVVGVGTTSRGQKLLDAAEREADIAILRARMRERNLRDNPAVKRKKPPAPPSKAKLALDAYRAMTASERAEHRAERERLARRRYTEKITRIARELGITHRAARKVVAQRNGEGEQ